jgi:hypothetical protein
VYLSFCCYPHLPFSIIHDSPSTCLIQIYETFTWVHNQDCRGSVEDRYLDNKNNIIIIIITIISTSIIIIIIIQLRLHSYLIIIKIISAES